MSAGTTHWRELFSAIHDASLGELQFSLVKTFPPNSAIAEVTSASSSLKLGAYNRER